MLVNNAARQQARKSILDISSEDFDATLKTNLYAMFWLTKAAVPLMPAGSSIINTASVVADDPPESLLDYSATKGGVVVFTKGLAKQLAGKGIRVNAIAPLFVLLASDEATYTSGNIFGSTGGRGNV